MKDEDKTQAQLIKELEELRKTNYSLNYAIDNSLECISFSDPKGFVTRVNKSFLKMLGLEEGEVIGKHGVELSPVEEGIYESTTGKSVVINK